MVAMRYMLPVTRRASTWAFLSGIGLLAAIGAVRDAIYLNFTSWLQNYDAIATCAALVTFVGYWISRTRAEARHDAEATYGEIAPHY